jgi:hypothetical protein
MPNILRGASVDLTVPEGGLWLNEADPDSSKHLTVACAKAIRVYLRSNLEQELGCMIEKVGDTVFRVVPFTNTDPTATTVRMGTDEDFIKMLDLYKSGRLWGWFHSHPKHAPYPSMTDLNRHSLRVNMGIYSGTLDTMCIFNTDDLDYLLRKRADEENMALTSVHGELQRA